MPKPDFMLSTYIRCTQDALWDALRDPRAQAAYDFLGQSVAKSGKTMTWTTPEGMDTLVCTEIEATPKSRPIIPLFWSEGTTPETTFFASALATGLVFIVIGLAKGHVTHRSLFYSALETLLVGGGAASLAFVTGGWLKNWVG